MTTRRLHPGSGNHGLFLAYRIISRCYFHLPVLLLYFWTIDMGMYRIIFLLALYGLTSTFSSGIPGWLLRFLSPRQTVIAGELMKARMENGLQTIFGASGLSLNTAMSNVLVSQAITDAMLQNNPDVATTMLTNRAMIKIGRAHV